MCGKPLLNGDAVIAPFSRLARSLGLRFAWVGVDGGYGKEPQFLKNLDDEREQLDITRPVVGDHAITTWQW